MRKASLLMFGPRVSRVPDSVRPVCPFPESWEPWHARLSAHRTRQEVTQLLMATTLRQGYGREPLDGTPPAIWAMNLFPFNGGDHEAMAMVWPDMLALPIEFTDPPAVSFPSLGALWLGGWEAHRVKPERAPQDNQYGARWPDALALVAGGLEPLVDQALAVIKVCAPDLTWAQTWRTLRKTTAHILEQWHQMPGNALPAEDAVIHRLLQAGLIGYAPSLDLPLAAYANRAETLSERAGRLIDVLNFVECQEGLALFDSQHALVLQLNHDLIEGANPPRDPAQAARLGDRFPETLAHWRTARSVDFSISSQSPRPRIRP
jgi:hypothetical protein